MRIKLTRKFALCLNGVDLSKVNVGSEFDLPDRSAKILIAEGWAEPVNRSAPPSNGSSFRPTSADN